MRYRRLQTDSGKSSGIYGSLKLMQVARLSTWNASPATATAIQAEGLTFTRAQIADRAELHEHVRRSSRANDFCKSLLAQPGFMLHLYDLAAKDQGACNILLARAPDRSIVASCIIYSNSSEIAAYAPLPGPSAGGIVGLVVDSSRQQTLAVDGLVMVAVSHLKGKALQSVDVMLVCCFGIPNLKRVVAYIHQDDCPSTLKILARLGLEQVHSQAVTVHDVH